MFLLKSEMNKYEHLYFISKFNFILEQNIYGNSEIILDGFNQMSVEAR